MKASRISPPEDLAPSLRPSLLTFLNSRSSSLQLEVVPVFTSHEDAGVAVLQFKVMDALEDLRKGLSALEVQMAVIGGLGQAVAAVVDTDQVLVRLLGRQLMPSERDESN